MKMTVTEKPMVCPRCSVELARQGEDGPGWSCRLCSGRWLDSSTFVSLCADEHGSPVGPVTALGPRRSLGEPVRYGLCPVCSDLMDRMDLGGATGIELDACRRHGVWLDVGEIEQLRELARTGAVLELEKRQRL